MAVRYYQPLTGPVWREPVASRMQWLPQGQPRAREIPSPRLGGVVMPFVAAVAVATSLAWMPTGTSPAVPAPQPGVACSVIAPFQPPSYDPRGMQWVPTGRDVVRNVPRPVQTWSLLSPFPIPTAPFDPAQFPQTLLLRYVPTERRQPSLAVEPFLTDVPVGVDVIIPNRVLPIRRVEAWIVVVPFLPPAFDPTQFPKILLVRSLLLERRQPSIVVEPFTAALYRPEGLQWIPRGAPLPRQLVRPLVNWMVGDPLPHPVFVQALPLYVDDLSTYRYGLLDQSGKRYLVIDQSSGAMYLETTSDDTLMPTDQSGDRVDLEDTT